MKEVFICSRCKAKYISTHRKFECDRCGYVPEIKDYKKAFEDVFKRYKAYKADASEEFSLLQTAKKRVQTENVCLRIALAISFILLITVICYK